jgi:hypothetical protein
MAEVWVNILSGFKEIFSAPFKDPSILWLLAPIALFWLVLEIYFGKYKREKLGWNTTLGYGMTMFWVVVISLRTMFENNFELFSIDKILFLLVIATYSIFIIIVSFTHKLREKVFFLVASPSLVYYLFIIAILLVHGVLELNLWVVVDLVILYIVILLLETILKRVMPEAPGDIGGEGDFGSMGSSGVNNFGIGKTGVGKGTKKF